MVEVVDELSVMMITIPIPSIYLSYILYPITRSLYSDVVGLRFPVNDPSELKNEKSLSPKRTHPKNYEQTTPTFFWDYSVDFSGGGIELLLYGISDIGLR